MPWIEVGSGCYARRYDPFDVTVGVITGSDGFIVLDTRGSLAEGRVLVGDLARFTSAPLRWVVNSHWHFDHTFGNAAFDRTPIVGHESVPDVLAARGPQVPVEDTPIVVPTETFSTVRTLDLGDRTVELVHLGRGHTDGDIVVRVPDANVVFAGDLIEESGPPSYGDDSFPLEWPGTVEHLSGLLTSETVVVPGHGAPVDQAYVIEQRGDINTVASTIRQLWDSGVREEEALTQADWPALFYDEQSQDEQGRADRLSGAVARGYAALRAESGPGRALPLTSA